MASPIRPSRLLKVSPGAVQDLYLVPYSSDSEYSHAALSYCWGGRQEGATTNSNVEERCKGFTLDSLPQTLQDAIKVTTALDLTFIWIYLLCIIQDNIADKRTEITRMGYIFYNVCVTIIAETSKSVSEGFLSPRVTPSPPIFKNFPFWYPNRRVGSLMCRELQYYRHWDQPLNKRGWALQERFLSPRQLIFSARQLRWHCEEQDYCDGGLPDIHPDTELPSVPDLESLHTKSSKDFMQFWDALLNDYTRRQLSDPTDKLFAISGIAEYIGEILGFSYITGLWK